MCNSDPQVKLGEEADKIMRAFVANYPAMAQTIAGQAVPLAQSDLAATQATYPALQQLGIQTDLATASGPGQQLVDKALQLEKQASPEYYGTRTAGSNALGDLFKSIDLSGALSGGERSEIERGINRGNLAQGINNQTPLNAVENAMQYGQASTARKLAQQGVATQAVGVASGLLPTLKTNIDPFQIATGRASTPASSQGLATTAQLGSGVSGSLSGLAGSAMDANVSRRSSFEKFMSAMPSYSG